MDYMLWVWCSHDRLGKEAESSVSVDSSFWNVICVSPQTVVQPTLRRCFHDFVTAVCDVKKFRVSKQ